MSARPGILEPVPPVLERVLRRAVLEHVREEVRRVHPAVLHAGVPGGPQRAFELDPEEPLDLALRTDIVEALTRSALDQDVVPLLWLTRPCADEPVESGDLAWAAAARSAGGELGVTFDLVVVTKHTWRDPRTGVGRSWRRIRDRGAQAGGPQAGHASPALDQASGGTARSSSSASSSVNDSPGSER